MLGLMDMIKKDKPKKDPLAEFGSQPFAGLLPMLYAQMQPEPEPQGWYPGRVMHETFGPR